MFSCTVCKRKENTGVVKGKMIFFLCEEIFWENKTIILVQTTDK